MGGADGSFCETFQSTERLGGFLMSARRTSGLWGMVYEAASMLQTEGKVVAGRGGYKGLSLGWGKQKMGGRSLEANSHVNFSCWFVWVVVITWFKSARSGQLLWPEEEHSSFTFGSSNCMETSVLSGSFFKWSPRITHHNKVWKRKMNEYRQYIFSWTMRIYV